MLLGILSFVLSVAAIWAAIRSARSSRMTAIISILQEQQIREARKIVFSQETPYDEDENNQEEFYTAAEQVCHTFDSVYNIYSINEIPILNRSKYNIVHRILFDSYSRSILILYLKCYAVIKYRRETFNHPTLWTSFEKLYQQCKNQEGAKIDTYIEAVLLGNKPAQLQELKKMAPITSELKDTMTEKECYNLIFKNIDRLLFRNN